MGRNLITAEVLVVGGGTGGTVAAIQAARRGVETILVSEYQWLGGMLTAAGVCAPDGNELAAWQTGLWGAYLRELRSRQPGGLDNGWVSLFTYHPGVGAAIFADWVKQLPNLQWISGYKPLRATTQAKRITEVEFTDFRVKAQIIIDGTELGDLLALADIPHRWGWELQAEFNEPSAPSEQNNLMAKYPVQAPTWVFLLQDYANHHRDRLPQKTATTTKSDRFENAWNNYDRASFLNYGKLQEDLYMINWPICGNDYGQELNRLLESETSAQQFKHEAYQHSWDFADYLQSQLGSRFGLAENVFSHDNSDYAPRTSLSPIKRDKSLLSRLDIIPRRWDGTNGDKADRHGAFAIHPYYRESRRLLGQVTITENALLPVKDGTVAPLPIDSEGQVSAIAIGNYANDHHYPGVDFPLEPKSIRWGGRVTGTPFTIPYGALISESFEGLLVCEKNISVSHIANGCTRLQPVVMNIGQAAGMAAALCIELNCQPAELPVSQIQQALLSDHHAPAAIVPLYNLAPDRPDWLDWQKYYLEHPENYPQDGNCPCGDLSASASGTTNYNCYQGIFHHYGWQKYGITLTESNSHSSATWRLITLNPEVDRQLLNCRKGQLISVVGRFNLAGDWLIVEAIESKV